MTIKKLSFKNKRILITGGTGSLGKTLIKRLLETSIQDLDKIIIFSRDEAKQHQLRSEYINQKHVTENIIYEDIQRKIEFQIGDVRDKTSLTKALSKADIVFHAAALKQVPSCEYFPEQAILTNVIGAQNIVDILQEKHFNIETIVGISTDKAVQPINVMGMTKSLQERIFVVANIHVPQTKFVLARYGNVLASRGSVIPYFHECIRNNLPLPITDINMTRFLLSLEDAVDIILDALHQGNKGEIYVPIAVSSKITDIAKALIDNRKIKTIIKGIRPGEKIHECLVSEEEALRTYKRGNCYVIAPMLPDIYNSSYYQTPALNQSYSSNHTVLTLEETKKLLIKHKLMVDDNISISGEFLR